MRTLIRFALAALLAVSVIVPAAADGEPELYEPCDTENETVGLDDLTIGIDTPAMADPVEGAATEFLTVTLDLAGEPVGETARVDVTLTIVDAIFLATGTGSGDFELYVNGGSSTNFNPSDGNTEFIALGSTAHCTDINVGVGNYLGDPAADLTLDFNVR